MRRYTVKKSTELRKVSEKTESEVLAVLRGGAAGILRFGAIGHVKRKSDRVDFAYKKLPPVKGGRIFLVEGD